jgi:hypothetical protein
MDFDPQKWFIGLMDFFSILLPGALLTYLLMDAVGPVLLTERYGKLAGAEGWAAFIFASYLFGHLVFLLGSWLDEFYDWARGYTLNVQIRRLALRNKLLPWPLRLGVWAVFRRESNHAVRRAEQVKKRLLSPLQADQAVNTFQWCKVWLNVESQPCLQAVQRLEADSKCGRSATAAAKTASEAIVGCCCGRPLTSPLPFTLRRGSCLKRQHSNQPAETGRSFC